MEERPTKRGGPLYWLNRRSRRFWIIGMPLSVFVLYPLSLGPFLLLARIIPEDTWASMGVIYDPILFLGNRSETIRKAVDQYTILFQGAMPWEPTDRKPPASKTFTDEESVEI